MRELIVFSLAHAQHIINYTKRIHVKWFYVYLIWSNNLITYGLSIEDNIFESIKYQLSKINAILKQI